MNVPSAIEAEKLLEEAASLNQGLWIKHNKTSGKCARTIADKIQNIDSDVAYVLGILHDVGRRDRIMDMRHVLCGYKYISSLGYSDSARICLTHLFPYKNVQAYNGINDCNKEETKFIQSFIDDIEYDDYDRLIQLCDAISYPNGPTYIEKRFVDVVLKRGFNDCTIQKWKAFLELKDYFD